MFRAKTEINDPVIVAERLAVEIADVRLERDDLRKKYDRLYEENQYAIDADNAKLRESLRDAKEQEDLLEDDVARLFKENMDMKRFLDLFDEWVAGIHEHGVDSNTVLHTRWTKVERARALLVAAERTEADHLREQEWTKRAALREENAKLRDAVELLGESIDAKIEENAKLREFVERVDEEEEAYRRLNIARQGDAASPKPTTEELEWEDEVARSRRRREIARALLEEK